MTSPTRDASSPFPEEGKAGYYVVGIGRKITISERLAIEFVKVSGDGRCPEGVVCVTAGRAELDTLVTTESGRLGGRTKKNVVFKVGGLNRWPPTGEVKSGAIQTLDIDGNQITLMDLAPYRVYDSGLGRVQSIDSGAYRALFYVGAKPPCFDTGPSALSPD